MIEELIQEEIIDETDVFVDIHQRIQVARAKKARLNVRKQFLFNRVGFSFLQKIVFDLFWL